MLICRRCHRTFKENTKDGQCPITGCGGAVIDIDKSFIGICTKLWNKGYDTQFCCESHFTSNEIVSPYLVFTIPMNDKLLENNPDIKDFIGYRYEYCSDTEVGSFYKYSVAHIPELFASEVERYSVSSEEKDKLSTIMGQLVTYLKIWNFLNEFSTFNVESSEDELKVLVYATPPMLVDGDYDVQLCDDSLDDYEKFLNNKKKSLEPFHKLAYCIIPANGVDCREEFLYHDLGISQDKKRYASIEVSEDQLAKEEED